MEILKNLLRDLTDKLDQLLGRPGLQEAPIRVHNENHPNTQVHNINMHRSTKG
jgi:hypothetical protein